MNFIKTNSSLIGFGLAALGAVVAALAVKNYALFGGGAVLVFLGYWIAHQLTDAVDAIEEIASEVESVFGVGGTGGVATSPSAAGTGGAVSNTATPAADLPEVPKPVIPAA